MNLNINYKNKTIVIWIIITLFFSSQFLYISINSKEQGKVNQGNPSIKTADPDAPLLWSHELGSPIYLLDISSDGNYIATGGYDNKLYLFHKSSSVPLWSYTTNGDIRSLAISSNGNYIVVGDTDGITYLFESSNPIPLWTYDTGLYNTGSIAITKTGDYIVVGTTDAKIYLFQRSSSIPLWTYSTVSRVVSVAISEDGSFIVSASDGEATYEGDVNLFTRSSSVPLWTDHTDLQVASVDISSDGEYIVIKGDYIGLYGNVLRLYHQSSPNPLWEYSAGYEGISDVAFSTDGAYVAISTGWTYQNSGSVILIHRSSSTPIWGVSIDSRMRCVSISSDGTYISAGSQDGDIFLFHKSTNEPLWKFSTGNWIFSLSMSADGTYVTAGNNIGNLYLFINTQSPGSFILSSDAQNPDSDGAFILSWELSSFADTYSVYVSNSYIAEINENIILLEEGITNLYKSIYGIPSGTYYYIVLAYNKYGNTLSNCIQIEVERGIHPYSVKWYTPTPSTVFSLSMSSDGTYIATGIYAANDIGNILLYNNLEPIPLWNSKGIPKAGVPNKVDISTDGNYLTAGGNDEIVYLFEKSSSIPLWTYDTGSSINSVAISADGNYIVAGCTDTRVYLFEKSSSTPLWVHETASRVVSVAISEDGSFFVSASDAGSSYEGEINLFQRGSSTPLWTDNTGFDLEVHAAKISANGEYIVMKGDYSGLYGSVLRLYHQSSPNPLWEYSAGYEGISDLAFSADGAYIAISTVRTYQNLGSVILLHRSSSTPLWGASIDSRMRCVSISSDGTYVSAGSQNGDIYVFHKSTNEPLWSFSTGNEIYSLSISADGTYIAAGTIHDDYLYLFANTQPPGSFTLCSDAQNPDTDGAFILSWELSSFADIYSVYVSNSYITEINENVILLEESVINLYKSIYGMPSGTFYYIVVAYNEYGNTISNCIQVIVERDTLYPYSVKWYKPMPSNVRSLAMSSDGIYIVAGMERATDLGNVMLYDNLEPIPLWSYTGIPRAGNPNKVVVSSDGNYVAAGGTDGVVYLFETSSSTPLWTYDIGFSIYSIAISSNGNYIVVGSRDSKVYIFEKSNPSPLWTYTTGSGVRSVGISSDGNYIVTASDDGTAYDGEVYLFHRSSSTPLWYQNTGRYLSVLSVAISSNGEYILMRGTRIDPYVGVVFLFHRSSSTPLWEYRAGYESIDDMAFSSNGDYIAIIKNKLYQNYGYVNLLHISSTTPLWSYCTNSLMGCVSISSDGTYIAAGTQKGELYVFDKSSDEPLWSYSTGNYIYSISMSANGNYIAVGTINEGYLYLFNNFKPPELDFEWYPVNPHSGEEIEFTASFTGEGEIFSFAWDWNGNGRFDTLSTSSSFTYWYLLDEVYSVGCKVILKNGNSYITYKEITIGTSQVSKSYNVQASIFSTFRTWLEEIGIINSPKEIEDKNAQLVELDNWIREIPDYSEEERLFWKHSCYTESDLIYLLETQELINENGEIITGLTYGDYIKTLIKEERLIDHAWMEPYQPWDFALMYHLAKYCRSAAIWGLPKDTIKTALWRLHYVTGAIASTFFMVEKISKIIEMSLYLEASKEKLYTQALANYFFERARFGKQWGWESVEETVRAWINLKFDDLSEELKLELLSYKREFFEHVWDEWEADQYYEGLRPIPNEKKLKVRDDVIELLNAGLRRAQKEGKLQHKICAKDILSPIEFYAFDSMGRVTGIKNGQIFEEIPHSVYDINKKTIFIFVPDDDYTYEADGTGDGQYSLEMTSMETGKSKLITFNAIKMPIAYKEIHQYTINWDLIYQGGNGVSVEIDYDGDGTIEHSFTSDNELNTAEYVIETITWPYEGDALQDGFTFEIEAPNDTLLDWIKIEIIDPGAGSEIVYSEYLSYNPDHQLWELEIDTTQLPDGNYILLIEVFDQSGFSKTRTFSFIIANWAALELLPSTPQNKAGRTMPIKFSLRIIEEVNPDMPFVINQELKIRIYDESAPNKILQNSKYGDTSKDYRIDEAGELYITNFKTSKAPATYIVEIYRGDYKIGWFSFNTVK